MSHTYDLTLLLDTDASDEQQAKIVSDVESTISGRGTLVAKRDWGARPLSYEIDHKRDVHYHVLQFTGPTELLESLDHSLKITDGVVRFRIIRQPDGHASEPPDLRRAPAAPVEEPVEEPDLR